MNIYNVSSINLWHKRLRTSPSLYKIIGYTSAQVTPAVATYYNFIYRIVQFYKVCEELPKELQINQSEKELFRIHKGVVRNNVDSKRKKRLKKAKETGKTVYRKNQICDEKIKEVLRRNRVAQDFIQILNQWLLEAVITSQKKRLLGSTKDLSLCVDGTLYPSYCNRYGKKLCDCSFKDRWRTKYSSSIIGKRQQLITKIIVDFLKQYCSQILIAKRRAIVWQNPLIPKVKSMHLWLTGLPQT